MTYARWLRRSIAALSDRSELSETEFEAIVHEARRRGALAGIPAAIRACDVREGSESPNAALEILAACLALAEPTPEGMLTMTQAAAVLGLSVSGLRKLVRRGSIQFAQRSKGAVIRFRHEWVDEYANAKAGPAQPVARKVAPQRRKLVASHGFDPALLL